MSASLGEMNRSEAERCIEIAQTARQSGDLPKAQRFLSKSISMFETSHATRLLSEVQTEIKLQSTKQSSDHSTTQTTTFQSTTTQSTMKSSSQSSAVHEPKFTPEQQQAARKVVKQTNYYEILGLPLPSSTNEVSESDIKSAYRKMALKFHPDKNHAPEAEEAFKKVSAAFQCLSDPSKRRIYDQSGYNEPQAGGGGNGMRGFNGFHGFAQNQYQRADDFSPEDIFNMFFGMNAQFAQMQGRRVFTQRMPRRQPQQQPQQQQQEGGFQFMSFIHLLPLLLLLLFSFLSAPSATQQQPFSLSQTRQHSYQSVTPSPHNLPFWVDSSIYNRINRESHIAKQIYNAVEQEYVKQWREGCAAENREREKLSKEVMYAKSRGEGTARHLQAVQRLQKYESKNCDKINEFYSKPKR